MNNLNMVMIHHVDGREQTLEVNAASRLTRTDPEWSFHKPPPRGWQHTIPKYRVSRDLGPAQRARYRLESPYARGSMLDVWQYGERQIKAGEEIETKAWPHESFRPLNYAAEKVLEFFAMRERSRMTVSPWRDNQIYLDDGMSGPVIPTINPVAGPTFKEVRGAA